MATSPDALDDKTNDTTTADASTTGADDKATAAADDKTADKSGTDTTTGDDVSAADWRSGLSGGDDKMSSFLGRYASPAEFAKDAKRRFDDFRSGKLLKPLGDDPSESELKAYREANGVPDKPEGYLEKLSGGLVVGDDDRPVVDQFLAAMHGANAPAGFTDVALQTYYKIVEEQDAKITEATDAARVKCEDTLREEYGNDYRRNINAADAHLGTLPAELQEAINSGFNGKGTPLRSDPAVQRWLVNMALESNPLITTVGSGGAATPSAIAERIKEIEKTMREDRAAYNRDEGMQEEYRRLLDAREKLPKD